MKKTLTCLAALVLMGNAPAFAADWTGKITDSMCGTKKHAAEHDGKKMTDHDCVQSCVDGQKAKYAFVVGDKLYKIGNQDYAGLKTHAGHEVILSGDMKEDTITVTKIVMPPPAKK
jgi:hypothetical protein